MEHPEESWTTIELATLQALDAELRHAARIRAELKNDRLAARVAVQGLMNFVSACPAWYRDNCQLVLFDLASALEELEGGYVAPMLQKKKLGRGGVLLKRRSRFRGYLAAVMGGLMKHAGMKKEDASQWVAKRFGKAGYTFTHTSVENWRKEALEVPTSDLAAAYSRSIDYPLWQPEPIAYAERLTRDLIQRFPRMPLKK
jgi:hypothetical protein